MKCQVQTPARAPLSSIVRRHCAFVHSAATVDSVMRSEHVCFDVFGRRVDGQRTPDGWTAFVPGDDGKRRRAQIAFPPEITADEIGRYLGDLFHESATPKHPTVRLL